MSLTDLFDMLMPLIFMAAMLACMVLINWLLDRL